MNYLEQIKSKKDTAQIKADSKTDIDSIISQLKEVQLASLMNNKSSVILADSTDFGEKMEELGEKITTIIEEFRNDTNSADKLAKIAEDYKNLSVYHVKSNKAQSESIQKSLDKMVDSIKGIKMPELKLPAFPKIPAPIVNLPEINIDPITEAIMSLKESNKDNELDLDCYKAHDLTDGENKQYIGFVNPMGDWYIIENKIKENSIRYVFGRGNYNDAFKNAPSYQYELLSEAVNAL